MLNEAKDRYKCIKCGYVILTISGGMEFMIHGLKSALNNNKSRRYRGFSTDELVVCLGRMAVNDANKKSVRIDCSCNPILKRL